MDILDQLGKPDVKKLVEGLAFDSDSFERAVLSNPKLLLEAGRYRVLKMGRTANIAHRLQVAKSEKAVAFRNVRDKTGKRDTEGAVHDKVNLEPTVQRLQKKLNRAYMYEEFTKILHECYRHRQSSLPGLRKELKAVAAGELYAAGAKPQIKS